MAANQLLRPFGLLSTRLYLLVVVTSAHEKTVP